MKKQFTVQTSWPCSDTKFNEKTASDHKKSPAEHDGMVTSFFGSANVTAQQIQLTDIRLDLTKECNRYYIMFVFDPAVITTNTEIDVMMHDITTGPPVLTGTLKHAFYTIPMFKGMRDKYLVTEIHVRKAHEMIAGVSWPTVVLEGKNSTGMTVYYGDLTSQIPFPPMMPAFRRKKEK